MPCQGSHRDHMVGHNRGDLGTTGDHELDPGQKREFPGGQGHLYTPFVPHSSLLSPIQGQRMADAHKVLHSESVLHPSVAVVICHS